jgi:hypothetical protein
MVFLRTVKLSVESGKHSIGTPCLVNIADKISKTKEKKYSGFEGGMKLSLAANLVLN